MAVMVHPCTLCVYPTNCQAYLLMQVLLLSLRLARREVPSQLAGQKRTGRLQARKLLTHVLRGECTLLSRFCTVHAITHDNHL